MDGEPNVPVATPAPAVPSAPVVEEAGTPADFDRVAGRVQARIAGLEPLESDAWYAELAEMSVPLPTMPTFQTINDDLQRVQAYLDRCTAIYMRVYRHSLAFSVLTGLLTDGWVKFSREKSEGNRTGEAKLKMAQFIERGVDVQTLLKAVDRVARNLESKHKSLSEQLECMGRMLRMSDYSRTMPDYGRQEPGGDLDGIDVAPTGGTEGGASEI